ncbi:MAG: M23 family metallopeptidase [Paludibacteraceae bacterium]|nr:M23 family metallopeptidase [Paludibacteraceae bacterium]
MEKLKELIVLVLAGLSVVACGNKNAGQETEQPAPRIEYGIMVDSFRVDTGCVQEGQTLGGIFNNLGATQSQIAQICMLPREQFDYRQLRPGKTYYAFFHNDTCGMEQLCYWVYLKDIREAVILHLQDSLHVERIVKPIDTIPQQASAVIESSLWNAMVGNNLPIDLALELSEIYAWTIDFFGLQKGDSIRVYYDEHQIEGEVIGIGRIYAANFYHAGKWQEAFYFNHTYYDGDGKSLKKAFLKAPLNYKRISSRFTYARKHPIFKTVRPHTGVDYAAPMGTPVVSIGDGVVVEKGYKGGGGNTVKIKHNSTYTTAYLHLSKYGKDIAVGKHVMQGQVIGYVGSTGNSTGPHLDFRIWKNGSPIDPLKLVSPPTEPVPNNMRAEFDSIVTVYRSHL